MTECTLHNLLTSCQYPQVFWIYQMNDYDENILLTKGTKQEMLEDDENSFDLIDHINDVVEYWTIREDGAMFVRIRMDDRAKELFSEDYVKKWDRFNPLKRPYLYTAELDDFTNCIYGSSEYLHPYGDPLDCHHFDNDDRKTENLSEVPNNCDGCKEGQEDCYGCPFVEPKDEPQTNKDFKVTYTCSFTDCDNFKNFGFGEKCIECKRKQSEAKHKDEPQTYVINPQEPTNDDKCFECDDFFTCGGKCNKIEDEPQTERSK